MKNKLKKPQPSGRQRLSIDHMPGDHPPRSFWLWLAAVAVIALLAAAFAPKAHASTFTPSGYQVYPTRNDVATTTGDGRNFREETMAPAEKNFYEQDFAASGLTLPAASTTLYITASAGTAYIQGYYVNLTRNTVVDMAASTTNCLYLELTTASGLVTGVRWNRNATCIAPSTTSFLVASGTASATSITVLADWRRTTPYPRLTGTFVSITIATTSGLWTVPGNVRQAWIEMLGAGGGGSGDDATANPPEAGGAGAYRVEWFGSLTPGAKVPYQIGTGGAGGSTAPGDGADGTGTWFLSSGHIANPGTGGIFNTSAGVGGAFTWAAGLYGKTGLSAATGVPADSWLARATQTTAGTGSPSQFGAGGPTGGYDGSNRAGGAGGDGVLIIHY